MEPLKYEKGPWLWFTRRRKNGRYVGILPDGRRILRSRLVMMNFLHANHLPSGLVVHHKDRNSTNDDISNLQLMTLAQHTKFHLIGRGKYGVSIYDLNKYRKIRRQDPKVQERERIAAKEYNKTHSEERRLAAKEYYNKKKHDPVFREKNKERCRIYRLKQRREAEI